MGIKVTNMVKFYTLLLLNTRPMHGYEIIKEISEKLSRRISAGQIYPFLQSLAKAGYIAHSSVQQREKKSYHLTASGKKFVGEMLDKFAGVIDSIIESKVRTCTHCRAKILGLGHVEKMHGKSLIFCCPYCAASYRKKSR